MINQFSRNLKSQHLLIFISLIIFAMIATTFCDHIANNSTTIRDLHTSDNASRFIHIPIKLPKIPLTSFKNHSMTNLSLPTTLSKSTRSKKISPNTQRLMADNSTPLSKLPVKTKLQKKIEHAPGTWQTVIIKKGDSPSTIFSRMSISYNELEKIIHLPVAENNLKRFKPGEKIQFSLNAKNQIKQIRYAFNDISTLIITRLDNDFTAKVKDKPLVSQTIYKEFAIRGSVANSINRSGLPSGLYAELRQILHNSLNFNNGIRTGDHFDILYQEYFVNGKKYKPGHILLVTFNGQKNHLTAVRFTNPTGASHYYTPEGSGLEAAFLTAPLKYKYISSYYSLHRLDPYLHRYHPHLGVDYAAAKGTPIHSVGDGVVVFRGWDSGYGNAVIVKYDGIYKALYGHMSRFASNLRVGQHVNKGEVIGYVGSTGWATGSHLHFGWFVNNIPKDPLKYTADATSPVPYQYRHSFLAQSKLLLDQLQMYRSTQFAENKTDNIHHT